MALVLALTAGMATTGLVQSSDTQPWTGIKAIGKNHPHAVGQRIYDLKNWGPGSDDDAELLRAQADRIDIFTGTKANRELNI